MNFTNYLFSNFSSLQCLLGFLLLTCGLFVSLSTSPIESVLFLIATFLISGVTLMTFMSEFFGILIIMIYVGAIAVLFLFIIMMLNVKNQKSPLELLLVRFGGNKFLEIFFVGLFLCLLSFTLAPKFMSVFSNIGISYDFIILDSSSNLENIAQVLYNYHIDYFLIAGLILLVALIGASMLTLRFNVIKTGTQVEARQLSRSENFLSFFG